MLYGFDISQQCLNTSKYDFPPYDYNAVNLELTLVAAASQRRDGKR